MINIQEESSKIKTGEQLANFLISNPLDKHPFFLNEKKNNIGYVAVILENGRELDIPKLLADLISMTTNYDLRAKLVPQLYDELGSGELDMIHVKLIARFLNALKKHSKVIEKDIPKLEEAYQKLNLVFKDLFNPKEFYSGLGVAISNELIVQPIFEYFKDIVFNSDKEFTDEELIWLTAHDELEDGHVEDTIELANLVEPESEGLKITATTAFELYNHFWEFFDVVNEIELV